MTTDRDLQAKIDALRTSFTAGLATRFSEVDGALDAILPGLPLAGQSAPITTILEHVHKIAGSAGTFGFGDMGAIASQAEQLCERIQKNQHGDDEDALRALRGMIADIHAEVE
jgi:HPt (histidine-containing phosphotransfer) domain-containing protein